MKIPDFHPAIAACGGTLLLAASLPARADELQEAARLYKQGNFPQALENRLRRRGVATS